MVPLFYLLPMMMKAFHDLVEHFYYLPYFVLGFALAGGGKPAESHNSCHRVLTQFMTNTTVRMAAVTFLLVVGILCETSVMSVITLQSAYLGGLGRNVVPWSAGGPLADVVCHMFLLLLNLVTIDVCFMLPSVYFLSKAGSRTLYIYLLFTHLPYNLVVNLKSLQSVLQPYGCPVQIFVGAVSVFMIAIVLGSDLTVCLARNFVQPQWLMSFLLATIRKVV